MARSSENLEDALRRLRQARRWSHRKLCQGMSASLVNFHIHSSHIAFDHVHPHSVTSSTSVRHSQAGISSSSMPHISSSPASHDSRAPPFCNTYVLSTVDIPVQLDVYTSFQDHDRPTFAGLRSRRRSVLGSCSRHVHPFDRRRITVLLSES